MWAGPLGMAGQASRRVGNAGPFGRDTGHGMKVIATNQVQGKEEPYRRLSIRDPSHTTRELR